MSPEIAALWGLQRRDVALSEVRRRHAAIPTRRHALTAARDEARAALERAKHDLDACRLERRRFEKETEGFEDQVARLERQLFDVKTNEEYTAMQHQIANVKTKRSDHETAILESMEREEALAAAVKEAEAASRAAERAQSEGDAALDAEQAELESQIADRTRERDAARAPLTAPLLARYDRLLQARDGAAVVEVQNGACGGCHRALTPHDLQVVKQGAAFHACEGCGRIVVVP